MVALYAKDNAPFLQQMGFRPDNTNLRLAHWFGPSGAVKLLAASPDTPVDKIFSADVISGNPVLAGKTAGQVIELTNRQMTDPSLREFWTSRNDVLMKERSEATQQTRNRMDLLLGKYMQEANAAPPGSQAREDALQKLMEHRLQMETKYESMMMHPPEQKPVDAWQAFGSASFIVAMLGGLMARQHATAALTAGGDALQAIKDNNHDQYEKAYKVWEKQSDMATKMLSMENEDLRTILDEQRMSVDDKRAGLAQIAQMYQMTELSGRLATGDIDSQMQALDRQFSVAQKFEDQRVAIQHWNQEFALKQQLAQQRGLQTYVGTTDDGQQITFTMMPGQPETARDSQGNSISPPKVYGKLGSGSQMAPSPQQIHDTAQLIAEYKLPPLSGYAMRTQYGYQTMAEVSKLNPTYDSNQYWGQRAAEQTVGRRGATLMMASNAAGQLVPIVQDLSSRISRTDYPDINKILLAGREKTGDPDVVAFGQALNSLLYVYMRALNPSGIPRVADLERGQHMLQTAWSQGQLDAVLTQMNREIGAEKTALSMSTNDLRSLFDPQAASPVLNPYKSPDDVYKAYDAGTLTKDQATQILKDNFGFKPQ